MYNFAQHYRIGVFRLLDRSLNLDFYFGDKMSNVKKIDYSELINFKKELRNIKIFSNIYYQKGAISTFFKPYNKYIFLGEYYCISTWIILFLCFFSKKRIYLWTHGWYGNEGIIKTVIKKIFFNSSNGIFLYGNYAKELMIKEGFDLNKLHVIYNSLDYEKQFFVRKSLKISSVFKNKFNNDFPTLIFIGRLTKVKKLDILLDAQKKLKQKGELYNVVFVGEGDEFDTLKTKAIREDLINNVWFYGASYNEEQIGSLVYNADLCVSPGNVGLTAMHTMVYGTPVLTHNSFSSQMPEFEAIEESVTGCFFEKGNVNSLIKSISNWFEKSNNKREEIRQNCFDKIDTFYNPSFQLEVINKVLNEK